MNACAGATAGDVRCGKLPVRATGEMGGGMSEAFVFAEASVMVSVVVSVVRVRGVRPAGAESAVLMVA